MHLRKKREANSISHKKYRSLDKLSKILIILTFVEIISLSLSIEPYLTWYQVNAGINTLTKNTEDNKPNEMRATLLEQMSNMDWYATNLKVKLENSTLSHNSFQLATERALTYVSLPASALYFVWFYTAYRNLYAFGVNGLHSTPRRVVVFSFVPIINMWRPHNEMQEIWRKSKPTSGPEENPLSSQKKSYTVLIWWVAGWSGIILIATTMVIGMSDVTSNGLDISFSYSLDYTVSLAMISVIFLIISLVAFIFMVIDINKRQHVRIESTTLK